MSQIRKHALTLIKKDPFVIAPMMIYLLGTQILFQVTQKAGISLWLSLCMAWGIQLFFKGWTIVIANILYQSKPLELRDSYLTLKARLSDLIISQLLCIIPMVSISYLLLFKTQLIRTISTKILPFLNPTVSSNIIENPETWIAMLLLIPAALFSELLLPVITITHTDSATICIKKSIQFVKDYGYRILSLVSFILFILLSSNIFSLLLSSMIPVIGPIIMPALIMALANTFIYTVIIIFHSQCKRIPKNSIVV